MAKNPKEVQQRIPPNPDCLRHPPGSDVLVVDFVAVSDMSEIADSQHAIRFKLVTRVGSRRSLKSHDRLQWYIVDSREPCSRECGHPICVPLAPETTAPRRQPPE